MKTNNYQDIQLIITVALRKEIARDWFRSCGIQVHTLSALKSGALRQKTGFRRGILVVVTGIGLKASEEAACWIRDNLDPLFVVNIGTCGITTERHTLGEWMRPQYVADENGETLELDSRFPFPLPENVSTAKLLVSVGAAKQGNLPPSLMSCDAIDMECFAQATVFSKTYISFHCLKFSTDYTDSDSHSVFSANLELFRQETKKLFCFLEPDPNNIKVTTVVPVYNRERTIKRAIDTILSQSFAPEEIIVVDDCSTDKTREALESYKDKISWITLPMNSGPSKARNEGIKHATSEWIAFMDSDDCWEKNKLKSQIEYLRKYPYYQILQSEEKWFRNGMRVNPCKHHEKPEGWIFEPSLERCLISPSSVLAKKSLIEKYGCFNENFPVCEDYDLWLRISRHHPVGLDHAATVIKFGGHMDQLSRKYPAMDRFRVESLVRLLKQEPVPCFREKIAGVLKKKLKILLQGYEKRHKSQEAQKCQEMLGSLP